MPAFLDKTWSSHDTVSCPELMKVYALGGKNNVSERHNELSEHKRSSSFPNLECEKTLALRGVEKFSRCV